MQIKACSSELCVISAPSVLDLSQACKSCRAKLQKLSEVDFKDCFMS